MIKVYLKKYVDLDNAKESILARYSKETGGNYALEYAKNGAPQLISHSLKKAYVSISHTDGWLAMALSDVKVGVDIERADREVSPNVCESIEKWTRIEAYAKWTEKGLSRDMLFDKLPDDIIITKRFGQYIISVCGDGKDFDVFALI